LFDSYRFNGISYQIDYMVPSINNPVAGPIIIGEVLTYLDFDDGSAVNSYDTACQASTVRIKKLEDNATVKRYFRPRLAIATYKTSAIGALGFSHTLGKNPWVDCSNPEVEHYGLKTVINNASGAGGLVAYRIKACAYLSFLNAR